VLHADTIIYSPYIIKRVSASMDKDMNINLSSGSPLEPTNVKRHLYGKRHVCAPHHVRRHVPSGLIPWLGGDGEASCDDVIHVASVINARRIIQAGGAMLRGEPVSRARDEAKATSPIRDDVINEEKRHLCRKRHLCGR
jgi:hypothetical protein